MQTIYYTSGIWNIEARVQDAANSHRLSMISAMEDQGDRVVVSTHTVLFEHIEGCDEVEEAKMHALHAVINGIETPPQPC